MPPSKGLWWKLALALGCTHIIAVLGTLTVGRFTDFGRIGDSVMIGTIYLPLAPWTFMDVPILLATDQMLPPPSALGWSIILVTWAVFYIGLGKVTTIVVSRMRTRAAA